MGYTFFYFVSLARTTHQDNDMQNLTCIKALHIPLTTMHSLHRLACANRHAD